MDQGVSKEAVKNWAAGEEPKQQFWVTFTDPGDGDQAPPMGPFDTFFMSDNALFVKEGNSSVPGSILARYRPQDVAEKAQRGWYIHDFYLKKTGLATSPNEKLVFSQFAVEIKQEPKLREFAVNAREVREVAYRVMARSEDEARTAVHDEGQVMDATLEESTVHSVEEITEMPEDVEEGDSEEMKQAMVVSAARDIVDRWEKGDLAAAVRTLDECLHNLDGKEYQPGKVAMPGPLTRMGPGALLSFLLDAADRVSRRWKAANAGQGIKPITVSVASALAVALNHLETTVIIVGKERRT